MLTRKESPTSKNRLEVIGINKLKIENNKTTLLKKVMKEMNHHKGKNKYPNKMVSHQTGTLMKIQRNQTWEVLQKEIH